MSNEVTKVNKNEVAITNKGLILQTEILNEIEKANEEVDLPFTPYGTKCAKNCLMGIFIFCKTNGIPFLSIDQTLLKLQVQNIGHTELNYATIPSEVYFDLRKSVVKNKEGEEKENLENSDF